VGPDAAGTVDDVRAWLADELARVERESSEIELLGQQSRQ
jgi:hypothetical protein